MPLNLIIAQSIDEFNFIKSKVKEDYKCLPLNLDLLLFCELNKITFLDLNNYLNNQIHIKALVESEKFLENCNFGKFNDGVFKARYKNLVRNYFNSVFFLKYTLAKLEESEQINKIFLSGWKNQNLSIPKKNFIIFDILEEISSKIITVSKKGKSINNNINFLYKLEKNYVSKGNYKKIIFLNFGYNFKRILFKLIFKKKEIVYLTFEKISLLKRLIFKALGIDYFYFKREEYILKKNKISNLNEKYEDKDICKILNKRNYFFHRQVLDLFEKCKSVEKFINILKPNIVFLNLIRGIDGYLATLSRKFNFNSICIPHGTVSHSFNEYDKIYKKIIAENVFSGDSKYFSIQSKIAKKSLSTHKIDGEALITGNLIFSDIDKERIKRIYPLCSD